MTYIGTWALVTLWTKGNLPTPPFSSSSCPALASIQELREYYDKAKVKEGFKVDDLSIIRTRETRSTGDGLVRCGCVKEVEEGAQKKKKRENHNTQHGRVSAICEERKIGTNAQRETETKKQKHAREREREKKK